MHALTFASIRGDPYMVLGGHEQFAKALLGIASALCPVISSFSEPKISELAVCDTPDLGVTSSVREKILVLLIASDSHQLRSVWRIICCMLYNVNNKENKKHEDESHMWTGNVRTHKRYSCVGMRRVMPTKRRVIRQSEVELFF